MRITAPKYYQVKMLLGVRELTGKHMTLKEIAIETEVGLRTVYRIRDSHSFRHYRRLASGKKWWQFWL